MPNVWATCKSQSEFVKVFKIKAPTYNKDVRELPDLLKKISGCPEDFSSKDVTLSFLVANNLTSRAIIDEKGLTPEEIAEKKGESARKRLQALHKKTQEREARQLGFHAEIDAMTEVWHAETNNTVSSFYFTPSLISFITFFLSGER